MVVQTEIDIQTKLTMIENMLWIVNKDAQKQLLVLNRAQKWLFQNWTNRMILCKSRQEGISTAVLGYFFIEAQLIPGLVVAVVSHEDYATRRLLDKIDIFHKNLPDEMKSKMYHDCIPPYVKVNTESGQQRIDHIKIGDKVLSYNFERKKLEYKAVLRIIKDRSDHQWKLLGSGHQSVGHLITLNHKVYTKDGYKYAQDIKKGNEVYRLGMIPNEDAQQMILGSLLGDGSLGKGNMIRFGQAVEEYARLKYEVLQEQAGRFKTVKQHGYSNKNLYVFDIRRCHFDGELNAKGLAIWYCDDGTLVQGKYPKLSTDSFSDEELCDARMTLRYVFGIEATIQMHGKYPNLYVPASSAERFFQSIAQYVPKCMAYKLPEQFRALTGIYQWHGEFHQDIVPYPVILDELVDTTGERDYNYCFDITVEDNHNYFTSLGLISNSDNEKAFENGSTIYIGTAGQRAFGRGDTIHRALVSEEAHYADAEKLLSGLAEAIPMSGYLVRESTPLGDSGYYYSSVQDCIEGKSDFKLVPFYWWLCGDYQIPRESKIVMEEERGELVLTIKEAELVFTKKLTEEQIRWRRWKIRSMRSENKGNLFPQEYIEDLESCWLGPPDKVFSEVDEQLQSWSLNAREPIRQEGILEIWKEPNPGDRYVFWVDPAGGEGVTEGDPHDGVVLRLHAGGLEQVAAVQSHMPQKPFSYKVGEIAKRYNMALLVVERNGVGKGVLNYLVNDISYGNLYQERKADGELSGKWGWNTDHANKSLMVGNTISVIKSNGIVSYDRKLIRQLKALKYKDGKIVSTIHDDRAMAFMGAITVAGNGAIASNTLAVGDYVSFKR